jgi:PhnB protein
MDGMSAPITPHLVTRGADDASRWYQDVFGAVERQRIPLPDGRLISVELDFGDGGTVVLADEFPDMGVVSPLALGGTYLALQVRTDDADALFARALAAGATEFHPLGDTFWGERAGQFVDPFGHRWGVAQHLRDVPPEEVARAAAEAYG